MGYKGKNPTEAEGMVVRGHKQWSALGLFVAEMEKEIAWFTSYQYRGLTLKRTDSGWMMIVRVLNGTTKLVSFYYAHTVTDCYRLLYGDLRNQRTQWKKDRY